MFYAIVRKKNVSDVVRYDNGKLSGEPLLIQLLLGEIESRKDEAVGEINYCPLDGDHLADPLSVRLILEDVFDGVEFFGDVPEWPELPKGYKG